MWLTVAIVVFGAFTALYLWTQKKFNYFADRGIPQDPATFPLGSDSSWKMLTGRIAFNDLFVTVYEKFKGSAMFGHYGFLGDKTLVLQDMDLIKDVMIKDFDHFVDRRDFDLGENKYLAGVITMLKGEKWKTMRTLMSPIFTSGKLKAIVPLIDQAGDKMVEHLRTFADEGLEFETKDMITHFTTESIGSTGFGIEVNCFKDPNSAFCENVAKLMRTGKHKRSVWEFAGLLIFLMSPKLAKLLGVEFIDSKTVDFFVRIVKDVMEDRKKNPKLRNDFIDNLTQAMMDASKGLETSEHNLDQFDEDARLKGSVRKPAFTKEELETAVISNAFLLFFAGFDTSSTAMATTMYFLAKNPDVQEKLYQEVTEAAEANKMDQHLSYSHLQDLEYLDMCLNESLRCFPLFEMDRICVKEYTFRGTNITVPKDLVVTIPAINIMKDERYFPNPQVYNPENFSKEAVAKRGPYPFQGFGHGPRNCIGKRFALMQSKIAIFRLVANYKLLPCEKTVDSLVCDPWSASQQPKGGMWVKIERRKPMSQ